MFDFWKLIISNPMQNNIRHNTNIDPLCLPCSSSWLLLLLIASTSIVNLLQKLIWNCWKYRVRVLRRLLSTLINIASPLNHSICLCTKSCSISNHVWVVRWNKDAIFDVAVLPFQTIACCIYQVMLTINNTSNIPNWNNIIILHPEITVLTENWMRPNETRDKEVLNHANIFATHKKYLSKNSVFHLSFLAVANLALSSP